MVALALLQCNSEPAFKAIQYNGHTILGVPLMRRAHNSRHAVFSLELVQHCIVLLKGSNRKKGLESSGAKDESYKLYCTIVLLFSCQLLMSLRNSLWT